MMAGVLWLDANSLMVQVLVGAALFAFLAIPLRLISKEEWHILKNGASRLLGRFQKKYVHPIS
jgi:hypothetical protein